MVADFRETEKLIDFLGKVARAAKAAAIEFDAALRFMAALGIEQVTPTTTTAKDEKKPS